MKNKNNSLIFSGLNLSLVIFWLGVIFYFSSRPGNTANLSPTFWFYVERKGAHIGEYFILTFLFVNFLKNQFTNKLELILMGGALSLLYAISDELHQLNVFGREGKISDVGFDLIGISLAGYLSWFLFNSREVSRVKNKIKKIFAKK
jgi:VanZ family protein